MDEGPQKYENFKIPTYEEIFSSQVRTPRDIFSSEIAAQPEGACREKLDHS